MSVVTIGIGVLVAVLLLIGLGTLLLFGRLFRKVVQGEALIVSRPKGVGVTFTGALVLPMMHRAEVMDISVKTIEIARKGREGMICKDNIRADIQITFFVRVNKTVEDVVKVAQAIGTERASHQETLQNLFSAKFAEALRTVGKQLDFADLYTHREEFRDRIIAAIGTDLNGYHLEDAAIDHLEQTPMAQLDPTNILDAQGIRKITELTALEHIRTNDFQRNEQMEITRQDVDAREAVLELERRRAEAEIRQRKGIETLKAQEEAATAMVQEEERLKAHSALLRTEELLGVQRENQQREIAVAEKNRERVLAVESERIEKDRLLEVVNRDKEVQLAKAEMEKEVEVERRGVAEVVRERIAVERTVAEQEEEIKRVRVVQEAERTRQSVIIAAEAEAQEQLVKDIKAAEAAEQAAHLKAKEQLVLAEAGQKSAELEAAANVRRAEGERALAGAAGLAEAEVAERQALAEAAGVRARLEGEAAGMKEKAAAIEKVGLAEAAVAERKADAEAAAIREKLLGEAIGLEKKAAAMAALDEVSRAHEEFRLRLAADKDVRLAALEVQAKVAEAQASVLAAGLESADIDIVGGDSVFLEKVVGAVSLGKSIDGAVQGSQTVRALGADWLNGDRSFGDDATEVLRSFAAGGPWNLALLMKLLGGGAADGSLPMDPARLLSSVNGTGNGTVTTGGTAGTGK
ncbi:SPFH domain-containing protein [Streptacidiphilus neutrinimicus]|uniref:SPFH domain-containing protein n=1 Tax=Streptacidiphilus neutrinimicus TaxID=105420 RepID=UPI0005A90938|nr:SPFH domain-containing protein [Streptacidiphilus neutrinimicus]